MLAREPECHQGEIIRAMLVPPTFCLEGRYPLSVMKSLPQLMERHVWRSLNDACSWPIAAGAAGAVREAQSNDGETYNSGNRLNPQCVVSPCSIIRSLINRSCCVRFIGSMRRWNLPTDFRSLQAPPHCQSPGRVTFPTLQKQDILTLRLHRKIT